MVPLKHISAIFAVIDIFSEDVHSLADVALRLVFLDDAILNELERVERRSHRNSGHPIELFCCCLVDEATNKFFLINLDTIEKQNNVFLRSPSTPRSPSRLLEDLQ